MHYYLIFKDNDPPKPASVQGHSVHEVVGGKHAVREDYQLWLAC